MKDQDYPHEAGVLFVAIDPAQRRSGVAIRGRLPGGGLFKVTACVDNIMSAKVCCLSLLDDAREVEFDRAVVAVEYPKGSFHGSSSVRAAANQYIPMVKKLLKEHGAKKVEVRKIDPKTWQSTFEFSKRPREWTTKQFAMDAAINRFGWKPKSEDEADAALILEHARLTPMAERKKRVKNP